MSELPADCRSPEWAWVPHFTLTFLFKFPWCMTLIVGLQFFLPIKPSHRRPMKSNVCVSLLLYLCASIAVNAAERANIMGMASGSVLLSSSGEYGGGWMALNLLDGTTQRGWGSPQNKTAPHTIVIELPQRYRLSSTVLDNTDAQEDRCPRVST